MDGDAVFVLVLHTANIKGCATTAMSADMAHAVARDSVEERSTTA